MAGATTSGFVDAVMVATGDHQHARVMVEVVRAGKDVYCEKPLSVAIRDNQVCRDVIRRYERMFQLLALLYDVRDIMGAWLRFQQPDRRRRADAAVALDVVENLLQPLAGGRLVVDDHDPHHAASPLGNASDTV